MYCRKEEQIIGKTQSSVRFTIYVIAPCRFSLITVHKINPVNLFVSEDIFLFSNMLLDRINGGRKR